MLIGSLGRRPYTYVAPYLFHLSRKEFFDVAWPDVLRILPLAEDEFEQQDLAPWSGAVDHSVRKSFQHSLSVDFYGWGVFHSLRLRLAVADYCWVC